MHKHDYGKSRRSILLGIIVNGLFTVVELVVGIFANSLALVNDAVHDFTDTLTLAFSWWATRFAETPSDNQRTWGYHRATILAAFVNGIGLVLITLFIFYRAYGRILSPEPVEGIYVLAVAIIGIVANGYIVWRLRRASRHDVNLKSIYWHMSEDALGWGGVLVAGIVMTLTEFYLIDPLISIVIGLIVLSGAYSVLKEAADILLESVPSHIDIDDVRAAMRGHADIRDVHDLHVWVIGPGHYALSAHVKVAEMRVRDTDPIVRDLQEMLRNRFGITHVTIAFETEQCLCGNLEH
ncbi:MAG TPA: cation transporter [Methanomicrobia archaeon]|nr:cation transporter [Methanomicrobia archaeon]